MKIKDLEGGIPSGGAKRRSEEPSQDSARNPQLAEILGKVDSRADTSAVRMAALRARIRAQAAPMLDERRFAGPTWLDYTSRWANALVPIGVATALAAGLCLAWLAHRQSSASERAAERVALLRAATNTSSSRDLVDLVIIDADGAVTAPAGNHR